MMQLSSSTQQSASSASRTRKLIINGHDAPQGRYPYFSTLKHECGGALIAPDTILTAGHCHPHHLSAVQPHVGRYSFNDEDSSQVFSIRAMARHSQWKALGEDEFRHDVALLFLNDTAVGPYVTLNRNANRPVAGQELTAMGVGWTSSDWEHPHKAMILQEVQLDYLPNKLCELSSDGLNLYKERIHSDHLCTTGGPHNERDACAYDSGSPIIMKGNSPEEDVLVALVSWGEGCADVDFPAVNTRITDSLDFIEQSVCEHSAYPPPEFACPGALTLQPTQAPTTPFSPTEAPAQTTTHGQFIGIMVAILMATIYCIRKRAGGNTWMPSHKRYLDKQSSSETEYLYDSSPASSKASQNSKGSNGSSKSYDAIEILSV